MAATKKKTVIQPAPTLGSTLLGAAETGGATALGLGPVVTPTVTASGATGTAAQQIGSTVSKISSTLGSAASIADLFTSGNTWKGIGLCLAGGILVLLGLMQMTGLSAPKAIPVPV